MCSNLIYIKFEESYEVFIKKYHENFFDKMTPYEPHISIKTKYFLDLSTPNDVKIDFTHFKTS